MAHPKIEEQVQTIKKATKAASKSKVTATRFLRDAGILRTTAKSSRQAVIKIKK